MGFLSSAKHHDLIEADRLRMLQSKDAEPVKLTSQQPRACADCGSWNHKHQNALTRHPAIAVLQECQFHPFITVRAELVVVGWIQVKQRAGLHQYPALKGTTMGGRNSLVSGGGSSVGIQFDA